MRWLDIVDVTLEKGKGPRLDKLRIIQLIEGDLQLLMRICVSNRTTEYAEQSNRLSTANYGNRKGYDINTAILEKRLIHDTSAYQKYPTIHYTDDRQACYDRQLPEIGLLAERSFGMSEEESSLLMQVLKNFNHFLATAYGIAKTSYGGHNDQLGGTGQGNILSGAICRNISGLIFKILDNLKLGIECASPVTRRRLLRAIIAFVDDADFFSNGKNVVRKLQRLIKLYNKLYSSTGGAGQLEKNLYYLWKTFINGKGEMVFEDVIASIYVHHTRIEQKPIKCATKSLGVYYTPDANWEEQFCAMKEKMVDSVKKLVSTSVTPAQVHTFFHTYLIKKVFFGCGVLSISESQEKELCRIYESPILKKLGLSEKYPRTLLYVERNSMGLGLLKPTTIIAQNKVKLLVGNTRIAKSTCDAIGHLHELVQFNSGLSKNIDTIIPTQRYWRRTWIDEAYYELSTRGARVLHQFWSFSTISKNATIMDLALTYTDQVPRLKKINACRLFKRLLYPFELIGIDSNRRTCAFLENETVSQFRWPYEFQYVKDISTATWRVWGNFLIWLEKQSIRFYNDIDLRSITTWWHDRNRDWLIEKEGNEFNIYKRYSRNVRTFEKHEFQTMYNVKNCDVAVVRRTRKGNVMKVHENCEEFQYVIDKVPSSNYTRLGEIHNIQLKAAVKQKTALICFDAAVKGSVLAYYSIITDKSNSFEIIFQQATNNWNSSSSDIAEGRALLEVLDYVFGTESTSVTGAIDIYTDSSNAIKWSNSLLTASRVCKPGGEIWCGISRILERNKKVVVNLLWVPRQKTDDVSFEEDSPKFLIRKCDVEAKKARGEIEQCVTCVELPTIEESVLLVNDNRKIESINAVIKKIDAQSHEMQYLTTKFAPHHLLIDVNARRLRIYKNYLAVMKCITGFNHYAQRERMFNGNMSDRCDLCGELEDWGHIIQCRGNKKKNDLFLWHLSEKLKKVNDPSVDYASFVKNIKLYLRM